MAAEKTKYEKLRKNSERDRDLADALELLEWAMRRLKTVEEQMARFSAEAGETEVYRWRRSGEDLLGHYGIVLRSVDGGYT